MNSSSRARKRPQLFVFLLIIGLGVIITTLLILFKPKAEKKEIHEAPPEVQLVVARPASLKIPVTSQGTVAAKTQIKLVAEVAGKVKEMAALKDSGGFFKQNELLLRIDSRDYDLAIVKAEAQVAAAQQSLARVEAEAEQARFDLQKMGRLESKTRAYALREPHLKEARAKLRAAQADLDIARLQKQRTQIRAPFNGRVVSKQVDLGQYVSPGSVLADIYSVDTVEVRLPLSQSQLSLIDIPLDYENASDDRTSPAVLLTAEFAGQLWSWRGRLLRTEGRIDASNQLLYGIVEVNHPYRRDSEFPGRPPLTPGQFVKASIEGKMLADVFRLPRSALRYGREVWLLDKDNRLEKRNIDILHKDEQFIYVKQGLRDAEKIITSALDIAVQGMHLSPVMEETIHLDEIRHE